MNKEFELDEDGYPTEHTLVVIENWVYIDGYEKLLESLTDLMNQYGSCEKGDDGIWRIVTGGWSGNESIICSLTANSMFWSTYWRMSKCGGYYEFKK